MSSQRVQTAVSRHGWLGGQAVNRYQGGEMATAQFAGDDFAREVYCLLGLPFDAVGVNEAVDRVRGAAGSGTPCFLSTPNTNFLVACQADAAFRDSVTNSDLSVADGMPLVWMARLLGIPIRRRVAGSGLFEALQHEGGEEGRPLAVYFFGGPEGVAERACSRLNARRQGLHCVGFDCPGFGSVAEMSGEDVIARINASGADFLVVALGARKGQAWIEHNRHRIDAPVISHLGAVVNFVAQTVSRAPQWMQRSGLEWLWRIKEEPALWRRYWADGVALLGLVFTRLLPYAIWRHATGVGGGGQGSVRLDRSESACRLVVTGSIVDPVPGEIRQLLREAAGCRTGVVVDCTAATRMGPGLFGLLLMLRKPLAAAELPLRFVGLSLALRRQFRWNGVEYLLD